MFSLRALSGIDYMFLYRAPFCLLHFYTLEAIRFPVDYSPTFIFYYLFSIPPDFGFVWILS